MPVARGHHTATLLRNGRVLVTGGSGNGPPLKSFLASAALYDPATGKWSKTGSMVHPHFQHTATLLRDGRVLIAGGYGDVAELYDPVTGTFHLTGKMPVHLVSGTARPCWPTAACSSPAARTCRTGSSPTRRCTTPRPASSAGPDRCPMPGATRPRRSCRPAACSSREANPTRASASHRQSSTTPRREPSARPRRWRTSAISELDAAPRRPRPDRRRGGQQRPESGHGGGLRPSDRHVPCSRLDGQHRYGHTATLLPDGSVLITGGVNDAGAICSAELWRP